MKISAIVYFGNLLSGVNSQKVDLPIFGDGCVSGNFDEKFLSVEQASSKIMTIKI